MTLPGGTITFLFTDIEGSTRLWDEQPDLMELALARHDALLRAAIETNGGTVFKTIGDAFCAAFPTAPQALEAALAAQQSLRETSAASGSQLALAVRMALHTGTAQQRDGDYFGAALNRVARLLAIGHGGQILLSGVTQGLTCDTLPLSVSLKALGEHRLRDLGRPESVFHLCHPDLPAGFPPLKSLDNSQLPNNLPQQLTSFIGREEQISQIKELLSKTRLLTLTGSGGCGKTRLSLQVAADILEDYPDGVWLVELAPLSDPALVSQTVAQALGVKEQANATIQQTLTESLKSRRLLILLDNCEHLLTASAQLADYLLHSCPGVKLMTSSREALGITGETNYHVPSLTLPDRTQAITSERLSQYEAVRLFIDRAVAVAPAFAVTNQNAPAVAQLCFRLDGIPLAIELAAARVRAMPVERIEERLHDRFRLLTGGSRTALPRQQTLRALIDWSYDLLTDQEKAMLRRLSVFTGGWTLSAAESICAGDEIIEEWEALDLLTGLVDKSLVIYTEQGGEARYRLLETVRQYARDRLVESGEGETYRRKHRECFLALAEEAREKLRGPEQVFWLERLENEHDNLRAALDFCLNETGGIEIGLKLGAALQQFWNIRGHLSEGRERYAALLARPSEPTRARASVLNGAGVFAYFQGDCPAARSFFEESMAIRRELGDNQGIAESLINVGALALSQGDYDAGRSFFEQCLAMGRELGDKRAVAGSLNGLGNFAWTQGDYSAARSLYEQSLAMRRELGDKQGIAGSLNHLGIVAANQGDYAAARSSYEQSLSLQRELGNKHGIALSLNNLGNMVLDQGDYAAARSFYEQSLVLRREMGDKGSIAESLNDLGALALDQGDYDAARTLCEESLAIRRAVGGKRRIAESLNVLGKLANEEGDYPAAHACLVECLTLCRELGGLCPAAAGLEASAHLNLRRQHPERALRLYGAAQALRQTIGAPLPPIEQAKCDRDLAELRSLLDEDTYTAALTAGRAMNFEQAVACALEETEP